MNLSDLDQAYDELSQLIADLDDALALKFPAIQARVPCGDSGTFLTFKSRIYVDRCGETKPIANNSILMRVQLAQYMPDLVDELYRAKAETLEDVRRAQAQVQSAIDLARGAS